MDFVLLGFDQSESIRRFRFESVAADHGRNLIVVVADLTLARKWAIQLQNLPLLCRELLMRAEPDALALGLVTLTAADLAVSRMATEVWNQKKTPPGRGVSANPRAARTAAAS